MEEEPMASIRTLPVLLAALASAAPSSAADPYEPDNISSLFETLAIHGARQSRDLEGTGDVDYVLVDAVPRRSYEASVDTAGYFTAELTRRGADNGLQQTGSGRTINSTRSATGILSSWSSHASSVLNWIESGEPADRARFLRVDANGAAHTAASSQYTLQLRETTLYCPRYNNTGGQATVLVVQRVGVQESGENTNGCVWTADFYDSGYNVFGHPLNGSFTGSPSFSNSLAQNGMFVVATSVVAPGTSGSIQIAHTCGYGRVQAKAVSVEPATGFTFDTTCLPRPE
jgi:hypothetical protein